MMADTDTSGAVEELDMRVQALPQELQDLILSFTDIFHIPAYTRIAEPSGESNNGIFQNISACYRPPLALQLNRKTRAKFAEEYYGTTVFECVSGDHLDFVGSYCPAGARKSRLYLVNWLRSISKAHRGMIRYLLFTELNGAPGFYRRHPYFGASQGEQLRDVVAKAGKGDLDGAELVMACIVNRGKRIEKYDVKGKLLSDTLYAGSLHDQNGK